jgi:hypothetical protein
MTQTLLGPDLSREIRDLIKRVEYIERQLQVPRFYGPFDIASFTLNNGASSVKTITHDLDLEANEYFVVIMCMPDPSITYSVTARLANSTFFNPTAGIISGITAEVYLLAP